ncbi:MAG: helix-turn-helix transcriptional regulator [Desulfobacterales bacterium]|nr:helix-turn-helix transcriptional regulator [Desulfobacterales bacterium]
MTQREVAEKWTLSQQSISKIENAKDNHISLHTLSEYARVLGYELHFMLRARPEITSQNSRSDLG